MEQYIPKSALIAEIEKHLEYANNGILYAQNGIEKGLKKYERDLNAWQHCQSMCKQILSSLDTLEVNSNDVFIEKACEYIRNHIDQQLIIYHEQTWKKRDEFIEDFRKYMEGE